MRSKAAVEILYALLRRDQNAPRADQTVDPWHTVGLIFGSPHWLGRFERGFRRLQYIPPFWVSISHPHPRFLVLAPHTKTTQQHNQLDIDSPWCICEHSLTPNRQRKAAFLCSNQSGLVIGVRAGVVTQTSSVSMFGTAQWHGWTMASIPNQHASGAHD